MERLLLYVGQPVECFAPYVLDLFFPSCTRNLSAESKLVINSMMASCVWKCVLRATRLRISADLMEIGDVWSQTFRPASVGWGAASFHLLKGSWSLEHSTGLPFCLSLTTHHPFHREENVNISEVVWTLQEGQSWDNYSYTTNVQMLTFPDESVTSSMWWKYHMILVFASLQCHSRWQIQK